MEGNLRQKYFLFFLFFFHLTYSRCTSSLPSCLWLQRIFPSLPGSRLRFFLSRCKFSILTTRQPTVEFYLLTFPRFPLRKKEHKSYFGKNRAPDFRTSRCAAYLLDHSGDERLGSHLLVGCVMAMVAGNKPPASTPYLAQRRDGAISPTIGCSTRHWLDPFVRVKSSLWLKIHGPSDRELANKTAD